MKSNELKSCKIVRAIKKLAAESLPSGSVVTLYGSRARGDERPDSDWDLHILVPGESRLGAAEMSDLAWPFEDLGADYDAEINALAYSQADWQRRAFMPFYKNVVSEGVVLYNSRNETDRRGT